MSLLLETTLGDIVIDLDLEGSPELCKNVLKLAKARYYTATLIYNVQPNRFCQLGDPSGDGSGGTCIYGLIDTYQSQSESQSQSQRRDNSTNNNNVNNNDLYNVRKSKRRFLKSHMGRPLTAMECQERGRVVATEMNGIADTIGSQLLITIADGPDRALDGFTNHRTTSDMDQQQQSQRQQSQQQLDGTTITQIFRSVGRVVEDDNNVLDQIANAYCDASGRPYADIRVIRALVIDDPFIDPPGLDDILQRRGIVVDAAVGSVPTTDSSVRDDDNDNNKVIASPDYERPLEEIVEHRVQVDQIDMNLEDDNDKLRQQEEEDLRREDKSRAIVLEMLGDLPTADITAPENVLFVCKLNPVTEDEDLELIFSRFDEQVKAEIIRDPETGSSLQYAFVEFTTKEQAVEAYFKMNNALVDDRRIKVDFSQSVAKVWDRFHQKVRRSALGNKNTTNYHTNQQGMPRDPYSLDSRPTRDSRPLGHQGGAHTGRRDHQNYNQREPRQRGNRNDRLEVPYHSRREYGNGNDRNNPTHPVNPRDHHDRYHGRPDRDTYQRDDRDHHQQDPRHNNRNRGDSDSQRHRQTHNDKTDKDDRTLHQSQNQERGRYVQKRSDIAQETSKSRHSKRDFGSEPGDDRSEGSGRKDRSSRREKDSRRSTSRSRSKDCSTDRREHRKHEKKHKKKSDRHETRDHKHKKHHKHTRDDRGSKERDSKRRRKESSSRHRRESDSKSSSS